MMHQLQRDRVDIRVWPVRYYTEALLRFRSLTRSGQEVLEELCEALQGLEGVSETDSGFTKATKALVVFAEQRVVC